MFISSKKYAVLFDNASIGWLDLDSEGENEVAYETVSGTINYYVIADDDWYGLTEAYTALTGRQPIPPRWAFGNFSSRFGYHSQQEVLNTIERFNEEDIPVDAAIIDIYWFGKGIFDEMGNLEWYRDSFPEPQRMISQLENQGVKAILVTEPFILTTSNRWEEAVENDVLATDKKGNPYTYDFYFGNTGLIDIFDPRAREWFWNIYKEFTMQGIGGWWGDLGEPEVHPSDLQHINGSADEVHNAYGHEWGKMIYKGYGKDFPDQRPFILMRAGFAGSQRYGMIPWTGDVNRTWGGLYSQPEISLQMGMQGLAYMHSDLGGFAGGDTIDNELYIRWLQYGVFQPVYRPHAQEHIPAEPVFQIDSTMAYAKAAIELRYKLLPYNYNIAHENHVSGKPLMIPLFYEFPDNNHLLTYDSAYLWGDAFLVAPIKQPGVNEMQVYLPEGKLWTDFNNNQVFQGGRYVTVPVTINHIPVFVKGGSFIPMSTTTGNTSKYNIDVLEIHYYADKGEHTYSMYHDDGVTPDAEEKGLSTTFIFKAIKQQNALTLTSGSDKESNSLVQWFIHNITDEPVAITDGSGKQMEFSWDSDKNLIKIDTAAAINSEVNILLQKK
jgi:YD repeat-containing protein